MTADILKWPLGAGGSKVLLVEESELDSLVPLLNGEPIRTVPVGFLGLDDDPAKIAAELDAGPENVWLVVPHSDKAMEFHDDLCEALVDRGREYADGVFLPSGVTIEAIVKRLPAGRLAVAAGQLPRIWHFEHTLMTAWVWLQQEDAVARLLMSLAGGSSVFPDFDDRPPHARRP